MFHIVALLAMRMSFVCTRVQVKYVHHVVTPPLYIYISQFDGASTGTDV